MTSIKYAFGSGCVSLTRIFGSYGCEMYNIRYIDYKVIEISRKGRLKTHCYIQKGNNESYASRFYNLTIDIPPINLSFYGLVIHQGYLTNKHKKIIREGSLEFRRIPLTHIKYPPRSVTLFVSFRGVCSFCCVINVRDIVSHLGYDGIYNFRLHCLDSPRVRF